MSIEEFTALEEEKISGKALVIQGLINDSRSVERLTDIVCGKCGKKEVHCGYIDKYESKYQADYYHNFWHICLNCLEVQHQAAMTGYGQEQEDDLECPFCGYDWTSDLNKRT